MFSIIQAGYSIYCKICCIGFSVIHCLALYHHILYTTSLLWNICIKIYSRPINPNIPIFFIGTKYILFLSIHNTNHKCLSTLKIPALRSTVTDSDPQLYKSKLLSLLRFPILIYCQKMYPRLKKKKDFFIHPIFHFILRILYVFSLISFFQKKKLFINFLGFFCRSQKKFKAKVKRKNV